jgi:hypothetical protein
MAKTQSAAPVANPAPTLTPDALNAIIGEHVQRALAEQYQQFQAQLAEAKAAAKGKTSSDDLEAATVKAFRKAGFADVQPRVNTLTYDLWLKKGFKVKAGEKSIKVRMLRLFHADQVEPISSKEAQQILAEKAARREAKTADKLPPVSPVEPAAQPVSKTP